MGSAKRSQLDKLRAEKARLAKHSLSALTEIFGKWLPSDPFSSDDSGLRIRIRAYPRALVFWAFLTQVLDPGSACREAVRKVQRWHVERKNKKPSSGTGAYCQARKRLPQGLLDKLHEKLAEKFDHRRLSQGDWRGLSVRVIDGTGVSMPDTHSNQETYPQPSGQRMGCGFPVAKIVGIFCLHTGALLRWSIGSLGQSERHLFHQMLNFFQPGDLALADRGFCGFGHMAALLGKGTHSVMRLHQARKVDWRKGHQLGLGERLVYWIKPQAKGPLIEQDLWDQLPSDLPVRLIRVTVSVPGFRTRKIALATTLTDPIAHPAQEIAKLYMQRWSVEVFFRDIKQSMAMDVLRCKTSEMINKEITMHAIAYNLIRGLMADIAQRSGVALNRISFKGVMDALRQWIPRLDSLSPTGKRFKTLVKHFYESVANDPLSLRPYRGEPRVLKRRPKNYPRLTKPRHLVPVDISKRPTRKPLN